MITVRCFNSLDETAYLRHHINALNNASDRPDPFSTFEFIENYFQHDEFFPGGNGITLWFLAAFEDDQLVGYVPMKKVTQRFLWLQLSRVGFLVVHDTDRPHMVAKNGCAERVSEAFYNYLILHKQEWDLLEFQQQDSASHLFPPPASVALDGCLVRQWPSLENGNIAIKWRTLTEYYNALSRNSRNNIKRQVNKIFSAGNVELLTSSHPNTTPALLQLYLNIEPHSWKSKAKADIGRHPERIEYFKGLLDPRQPMRVSIQVIMLDGMPVAGIICGTYLQGLYALHIIYDDRLSRLAPGTTIMLTGIRQAIQGGHAFFNLLSGFGYFKVRWLAELTETRIAQIYRVGSFLYWRRLLGDLKRHLLERKKHKKTASYNPVRRDVIERSTDHGVMTVGDSMRMSPAEKSHIDALVATIKKSPGEFLNAAELAAAMPFSMKTLTENGNKYDTCVPG